jgi:hypothetical protein
MRACCALSEGAYERLRQNMLLHKGLLHPVYRGTSLEHPISRRPIARSGLTRLYGMNMVTCAREAVYLAPHGVNITDGAHHRRR